MTLSPTAVWRLTPDLVLALDEHLGAPVDSYLNGTQTWLTESESNGVTLEWRVHPVAAYCAPEGCTHYEVWDSVVAGLASGADPGHLPTGAERRALDTFWGGLECFPAYGDEVEPPQLAGTARDVLGIAPDAVGLVDHERIGDAWERSEGAVSIMDLLFDDLGTR